MNGDRDKEARSSGDAKGSKEEAVQRGDALSREDPKDEEADQARGEIQSRRSRCIKAPRSPTKAEKEQHEVSHWPFQEWCTDCVQGRGISSPHKCRNKLKEEHTTPTICMDYCFPEGRAKKKEGEEESKKTLTVLAMKEQTTGATYCSVVRRMD